MTSHVESAGLSLVIAGTEAALYVFLSYVVCR